MTYTFKFTHPQDPEARYITFKPKGNGSVVMRAGELFDKHFPHLLKIHSDGSRGELIAVNVENEVESKPKEQ